MDYNILLTDDDGRIFKPPGCYTEESLPSYVPKYFKDLPVQIPIRDLRGIFRTLVPRINKAFHKIKFTNENKESFYISDARNEKVFFSKGNFKTLYNTLLNKIK